MPPRIGCQEKFALASAIRIELAITKLEQGVVERKKYFLIMILVAVAIPGTAMAQWMAGAGIGSMAVSFDDDEVDKSPTNASFTLGYQFKSIAPSLAVE